MSNAAVTLSEPPAIAAASDWARPMLDRELAILGRLAEAGLEIAIALEAQAKGGETVASGDIAMAYARVARAVRQTLMLQSRLIEELQAQERGLAERKAAARASAARIVRGLIEDDDESASDTERGERLTAEAAERLEQEDFTGLAGRPFGEVVAGIAKDLGLSPDWLALAQDCLAAETALNAKPGETAPGSGAEPEDDEHEGMWKDPNAPPGEIWYYCPVKRRQERARLRREGLLPERPSDSS